MNSSPRYRPRRARKGDPLTTRELQVLALVAAGERTPVISKRLGISQNTIKSHLTSVYRKTGSENRVQATRHYLHHYTSSGQGVATAAAPAAAPAPDGAGVGSLIAHQIREIEVRIEQLGSAAGEVQRLRQAVEALREIDTG